MAVNAQAYQQIIAELKEKNVTLIAVSKTKPVADIMALYDLGQKDFGENYVQELVDKQSLLPADIRWHFIGHLQSNKVKYITPFVYLIHAVDSLKLLQEINKQGLKNNRVIDCLLQVHIAQEETKFGFDEGELDSAMQRIAGISMSNIKIKGLMGMASFTDNMDTIRNEFRYLKSLFDKYAEIPTSPALRDHMQIISMGMSSDYKTAIEEGSTMVRIGSLLFGARE